MPLVSPSRAQSFLKGVALIAAPIVGTILWDIYSQRVALELQIWSQSVIVQPSKESEKLHVNWDGVNVVALSRTELALENAGHRPIRAADITAPITVSIDSGRILEVRTAQLGPSHMVVRLSIDSARKAIMIDAPLLNPGDVVRFVIFADVTPPPGVRAFARIPLLGEVRVIDRRSENRRLGRLLGWPFYVVTVLTIGAWLFFVSFLYLSGYTRGVRNRWATRPGYAPTSVEYREFIAWLFGSEAFEDNGVSLALIDSSPTKPLTKVQAEALSVAVEKYIRNVRVSTHWGSLLTFLVFAIGCGYVLYSLIHAAAASG